MTQDPYQTGYRQAMDDFVAGKGSKPHKIKNLLPLILSTRKQEDDFLKGYKAGYEECQHLSMQKEARERLNIPNHPIQNRPTSSRLKQLSEMRQDIRNRPEHEPELG